MIDVLRLIPGFDFGTDVQGVIGIGMRGNWGHEGKIALIVDGQEMNELLFSTTYFGNRFDVSQIKRIEIIRGPGSSIYGGNAELGVINIVSKSGEDLKGAEITGTYGMLNDTYGRQNISLAVGDKNGDFKWSVAGFLGQYQRSNQEYTDIKGNKISLKDNNTASPKSVNVGLAYKGLSARMISEDYATTTVIQFDTVPQPKGKVNFKMNMFELKYDTKLSDKLTFTPKINYTYQKPWNVTDSLNHYNIAASKLTTGYHFNYDPTSKLNIIAGGELFNEEATNLTTTQKPHFYNGTENINFYTVSGYVQGLLKSKIAVFTAGMKVIQHNKFGAAIAPRIGITKSFKKLHGKVLYNSAFRAPSIENINFNPGIKPELTNVFEVEAGYKINTNNLLTVNVFDITINRPVVYIVDPADSLHPQGNYVNFDKSGTQGIEAEYKMQYSKWGFSLNYSYYKAKSDINVSQYQVPEDKAALLGLSNNKIGFVANFNVTDNFSINPSMTYLSEKYAITGIDTSSNYVITKIEAKSLLNLNLRYKNLFVKGLDVNVGVNDILNQRVAYAQPYKGGLAPITGFGTEVIFRIAYTLPFHKAN